MLSNLDTEKKNEVCTAAEFSSIISTKLGLIEMLKGIKDHCLPNNSPFLPHRKTFGHLLSYFVDLIIKIDNFVFLHDSVLIQTYEAFMRENLTSEVNDMDYYKHADIFQRITFPVYMHLTRLSYDIDESDHCIKNFHTFLGEIMYMRSSWTGCVQIQDIITLAKFRNKRKISEMDDKSKETIIIE